MQNQFQGSLFNNGGVHGGGMQGGGGQVFAQHAQVQQRGHAANVVPMQNQFQGSLLHNGGVHAGGMQGGGGQVFVQHPQAQRHGQQQRPSGPPQAQQHGQQMIWPNQAPSRFVPATIMPAVSQANCPAVEEIDGVVMPDHVKAEEVRVWQAATGKSFPTLLKRFEAGHGSAGEHNPLDSVKLVLEVMDFLLLPVVAALTTARTLGPAKPVYVMVGITGAGKSLTGNWMLGKRIRKHKVYVPAADPDDQPDVRTSIVVEEGGLKIGQNKFKSETFAPNVVIHNDFILIDFPGLCDTNGFEVRLGMDLAFRKLIDWVKPAHVLCLLPVGSFDIGKGAAAKDQLDKVRRLLPLPGSSLTSDKVASEHDACSWMIGITKCDSDFVMEPAGQFEAAAKFIQDWNPHFPLVVNINKLMFSPRGLVARHEFLMKLRNSTHTPVGPMNRLAPELRMAYGDDSVPGCLASDCLSHEDTSKLAKMLRAQRFEEIYFNTDATKFKMDPSKRAKLKESWSEAHRALKSELKLMREEGKRIRMESQLLRQTKRLALERRDPAIARLCALAQPGLKLGFVKSEDAIMMRNAVATAELFKQMTELTGEVHQSNCLKGSHFKALEVKAKEVKAALDKAVQELGWKDSDDLAFNKTMFAGSIVAVGGVGGLALAGATASVAGLATGGVATVVGLVVLGIGAGLSARNDAWSEQFKDLLLGAYDELLSTNLALLDHKKALSAVEQALTSLQVL